jgi:hypothetical protein
MWEGVFLPKGLVNMLRMNGLCTLNIIVNVEVNIYLVIRMVLDGGFGFGCDLAPIWSHYTSELQREHIHLNDNDDELAWYTHLFGGQYFIN